MFLDMLKVDRFSKKIDALSYIITKGQPSIYKSLAWELPEMSAPHTGSLEITKPITDHLWISALYQTPLKLNKLETFSTRISSTSYLFRATWAVSLNYWWANQFLTSSTVNFLTIGYRPLITKPDHSLTFFRKSF